MRLHKKQDPREGGEGAAPAGEGGEARGREGAAAERVYKVTSLSSVRSGHSAKPHLCRVPDRGHSANPFLFSFFSFFFTMCFKVRREKMKLFVECQIITLGKHISLPSARQLHSANIFLCRVLDNYTRQTYFFAECQTITLGKHISLPSAYLYRVFSF